MVNIVPSQDVEIEIPDQGPLPVATATGRRRPRGDSWARFAGRRFLNLVIVLLCLLIVDFLILRLIPGDPAQILASVSGAPDQAQNIERELGLDQSIWSQAVTYGGNVVQGDLGRSFSTNQPVTEIISERLVDSAALAGASLALVLLVSLPGGIAMGALTRDQRHRRLESVFTTVTSIVGALPPYFTATILAFVIAVQLRLLPVAGSDGFQTLVLPALAISIPAIAILLRIVRVETLDVMAQDYIRTARSKRLPGRLIYLRHTLPNVSTAALTIGGVLFAQIIGGAVIVEIIFSRNGLGSTLVQAVINRDYPVIQGVILVLGAIIVVVNAVIDLVLALIDPRTRTRQV